MIEGIASLSMGLSNVKTEMATGIAVSKKAMDQQEIAAEGLMKMIDTAVPPSNHMLDIKV